MSALELPRGNTFAEGDWRALANCWHPVAFSRDVAGEPTAARLLDVPLVVYRTSEGVVVAKDLCLHRGAALSLGRMEGDEIVCPYHGFRYSHDGQCTLIPAHPDRPVPKKIRLITYPAVERYGLIWACLSGEPATDLPEWPEAEDPAFRRLNLDPLDWDASAARQVENFLDVSHFSFVHVGTFGNPEMPEVPDYEVEPVPGGLHMEYPYLASNPDHSSVSGEQTIKRWMIYDVTLPFAVRLIVDYPGGRRHAIFDIAAPVSARKVRIFFFIARNFDHDKPAAEIMDWERRILNEDRPIVESQMPEELPLDLGEEFHIKADRTSIAYRQALAGLGLGQPMTS
jgi:phenylpropionate dioxygenase-like ring-hydroxylating dioxygenase large terminal subunit